MMLKQRHLKSGRSGKRTLPVEEKLHLLHRAADQLQSSRSKLLEEGWEILGPSVGFELRTDGLCAHAGAHLKMSRQPTLVAVVSSMFRGTRMRAHYEKAGIDEDLVVTFIAIRMLMSARRVNLSGSHDPQRDVYAALREELLSDYPQLPIPGVIAYERLTKIMELPVDVIRGRLSEDWASLIDHGESIALDEKLKHYVGLSPYTKKVLSKPDGIGLEVTQLAVTLEETGDPFLFGLFPLTSSKATDETISMDQIASWALSLVRCGDTLDVQPVIVTDCMYNSAGARSVYLREGGHFLMALRPNHWKELDLLLGTTTSSRPATVYARHKPSGVVVCRHWPSCADSKYKTVTTNAMVETAHRNGTADSPPIYGHYALMFNTCDKANKMMNGMWWPFRTNGHERRFSDIAFDFGFFNVYTACKYARLVTADAKIDHFLEMAGKELLRYLQNKAARRTTKPRKSSSE